MLRHLKLSLIFTIMIIVMATLFTAYHVHHNFYLSRLNTYFEEREDVASWHIQREGRQWHISIELLREATFPEAWLDIQRDVSNKVQALGSLQVLNTYDTELGDVYKAMKIPMFEGLIRGNFMEVHRELQELAIQNKVDMVFQVDHEYLYLEVSSGEQVLRSAIPRHDKPQHEEERRIGL